MPKAFDAVVVQENADSCRRQMRGRRYIHYKGGEYIVRDTTVDETTGETLVHYQSVEFGYRWTRTRANFEEMVSPSARRFEPLPLPFFLEHGPILWGIAVGVVMLLLLSLLIQRF